MIALTSITTRKDLIDSAMSALSARAQILRDATAAYNAEVKRTARVVSDLCIPVAVDIISDHMPEGVLQTVLVERMVEVLGLEGKTRAYVQTNLRASLSTCAEIEMTKEPRPNKSNNIQPQNVWRLKESTQ